MKRKNNENWENKGVFEGEECGERHAEKIFTSTSSAFVMARKKKKMREENEGKSC